MKRLFVVVLSLLLLTACGNSKEKYLGQVKEINIDLLLGKSKISLLEMDDTLDKPVDEGIIEEIIKTKDDVKEKVDNLGNAPDELKELEKYMKEAVKAFNNVADKFDLRPYDEEQFDPEVTEFRDKFDDFSDELEYHK